MDFQFWLYVIIAVILVLRGILKKQQTPGEKGGPGKDENGNPGRTAEKPRQVTFEELLREITEAKEVSRREVPPPTLRPAATRTVEPEPVVDYDEMIGEEEQDLEVITPEYAKSERTNEIYEEAKRLAFSRPSLEESMSVKDTVVEFGKFKVFEPEAQRNLLEEYTKDLHNPEGLKKAFVLTEIFNRKY